jgi:hypothetical protein
LAVGVQDEDPPSVDLHECIFQIRSQKNENEKLLSAANTLYTDLSHYSMCIALRGKKGKVCHGGIHVSDVAPSRLQLLSGGQGLAGLVLHLKSTAVHHHK